MRSAYPSDAGLPAIAFKSWPRVREQKRPPLAKRMPLRVPPGSTTLADNGSMFLTTTPKGTVIAWDLCGSCSVNVKACKCARPSPPRSVTYIWYQDEADRNGEDWNPMHRNYSVRFPLQDPPESEPRRVRKRRTRRSR